MSTPSHITKDYLRKLRTNLLKAESEFDNNIELYNSYLNDFYDELLIPNNKIKVDESFINFKNKQIEIAYLSGVVTQHYDIWCKAYHEFTKQTEDI